MMTIHNKICFNLELKLPPKEAANALFTPNQTLNCLDMFQPERACRPAFLLQPEANFALHRLRAHASESCDLKSLFVSRGPWIRQLLHERRGTGERLDDVRVKVL